MKMVRLNRAANDLLPQPTKHSYDNKILRHAGHILRDSIINCIALLFFCFAGVVLSNCSSSIKQGMTYRA